MQKRNLTFWLQAIGFLLLAGALIVGLVTRVGAVFQYVTFDIGPDPDQIRDAFAVIEIWQGKFPKLGPPAYGLGLGGFSILPLYYYLFLPFTLLGGGPAVQAFGNGFFSFLSIPLFSFLVYQILENISFSKRIFFCGLAGFWYSLLYSDFFISNFQWNPSSLPFFVLFFAYLYDLKLKNLKRPKVQCLAWAASGVVLAILMSLHSSALFVMPVVYVILSIAYILKVYRWRRLNPQLAAPLVGYGAAAIALLPYWVHEFQNSFSNTKGILKTITAASGGEESLPLPMYVWDKISNLFLHYINLIRQVYLWDDSLLAAIIAIATMGLAIVFLGPAFKGNRNLWLVWVSIWGLLLLAASNIDANSSVFYYKSLMIHAPIVLTVVALAYSQLSRPKTVALWTVVFAFVLLSWGRNLYYDAQFMGAKYGSNHLMNTRELAQIMQQLPEEANICDPRIARKRKKLNQYNYISTYVLPTSPGVVSECEAGNYVIHPKRILDIQGNFLNTSDYQSTYFIEPEQSERVKLWPVLAVTDNEPFSGDGTLFLETETAAVYQLSSFDDG
jgi:hypothetical protein